MEITKIFVSGIGTEVGKTIVSAIISEALNADYWKPIQSGDLENSDSKKINSLCSKVKILEERFRLKTPVSPHLSAKLDGIDIKIKDIKIPNTKNKLVIEGAGGLMVPINNKGLLNIDLIKKWNLPVILVSKHYLGSINHTLLSLEVLKRRKIKTELIIFNGEKNIESEKIIKNKFNKINTYSIPQSKIINKEFIKQEAERFKEFYLNC